MSVVSDSRDLRDGGTGTSAAIVNRSVDGGRTWSDPVVLDRASLFTEGSVLDMTNVVADPVHPGYAYAAWAELEGPGTGSTAYLSRTLDGGKTWSQQPSQIPSSGQLDRMRAVGTLLVLSDGALANVFAEVPPQSGALFGELTGPTTLWATRLDDPSDPNSKWSAPVRIAEADPKLMAGASAALAPDGKTIYVTWAKDASDASESRFSLMYAKSSDGGHSWDGPEPGADCRSLPLPQGCLGTSEAGPPPTGNKTAVATPSVAVAADGTVGVAFYDHRNDDCCPRNNPPRVTDFWFRHSHDGGFTWEEDHLAGPFDKTIAPTNDGSEPGEGPGFLGSYQGITPVPDGFAISFTMAKPELGATFDCGDCSNPTDIFFAKVKVSP